MDENLKLSSKKIEPLILALSYRNPSFYLKIKAYLDTRGTNKVYFNDPKAQRIFNMYSALYEKYKSQPKKTTMQDLIEKVESDPTISLYMNSILDGMYDTPHEDLDDKYIEDETISFIKSARAYEAALKIHAEIDKKNFGALTKIMEDAVLVNFDKDLGAFMIKDVDKNIDDMIKAKNEKVVSTGFPTLDKCIDETGAGAKTLNIISAISGGFKSGFLGNVAVNAMLDGKKVVYYTFETSTQKILGRLYAQSTRMSAKHQILDDEELKTRVKGLQTEGEIIVLQRGAKTFCADDMRAHLTNLKMYHGFEPDVIVVDYIQITLANSRKPPSEGESNAYYTSVAEELRNLGMDFNCPVWSAMQLGRQAYGENGGSKGKILASDTAASIGVVNTSDFFCAFNQSEKDKEDGKIYIGVIKSRNEGNGTKLLFDIDYDLFTMREKGVVKQGSNKNVSVNA
jgi:replicative DNA helicase